VQLKRVLPASWPPVGLLTSLLFAPLVVARLVLAVELDLEAHVARLGRLHEFALRIVGGHARLVHCYEATSLDKDTMVVDDTKRSVPGDGHFRFVCPPQFVSVGTQENVKVEPASFLLPRANLCPRRAIAPTPVTMVNQNAEHLENAVLILDHETHEAWLLEVGDVGELAQGLRVGLSRCVLVVVVALCQA